MGRILGSLLFATAYGALHSQLAVAELSDRHQFTVGLEWSITNADSRLVPWTEGGPGKLRYDTSESLTESTRLFVDYNGQIAPQFYAHVVLDYLDDNNTAGLTEAYVEWRPLPSSPMRHRFRFGAFYPAVSFENPALAWDSPYSNSFSAMNAWLGEEIRPIGLEWNISRRLGAAASPHEISASTALFYGNDTAGTLLFWRGWSVHDRQTRLNERLPLPTLVFPLPGDAPAIEVPRTLDPMAEIDHEPGISITGEWRYARRAQLALGFWDNRADATRFRDGQWAWGTRFWHLSAQFTLPGDVGLIAQRMRGDTDWLIQVTPTGQLTPQSQLATDEFDTSYLLVSKTIGERHRLTLRRDYFDIWRPGELEVDKGYATAIGWRYAPGDRLNLQVEWLEIESRRDLWPAFYLQQDGHTESLLQLSVNAVLFGNAG